MITSNNDFLYPPSLTIAVLASLRNTSPAPSQDTLLVGLQKLEVVLFRISLLDHSVHCAQVTTLKEAAIHCRDAIVEFWDRKILKGDAGLGENDWRMMGSWQDIDWDACGEGDLANLEAELLNYRERVEELMASMSNTEGQSLGRTTRSATAGILFSSQEELARGLAAQGANLHLEDAIEDREDAKLESPEDLSVRDSSAQEHQNGAQHPQDSPSTMYTS